MSQRGKVFMFPGAKGSAEANEVTEKAPAERDPILAPHLGDEWTDGRYTRTFLAYVVHEKGHCSHWARNYYKERVRHEHTAETATHVEYATSRSKGRMSVERWRAWCASARLVVDGKEVREAKRREQQAEKDAHQDNLTTVLHFLHREDIELDARPVGRWASSLPQHKRNVDAYMTSRVALGDVEMGGFWLEEWPTYFAPDPYALPTGAYYFRWGRAVVKPHVREWTEMKGGRKERVVWWFIGWYDVSITYGIATPRRWNLTKVSYRELVGADMLLRGDGYLGLRRPDRDAHERVAASLSLFVRGLRFAAQHLKEASFEALRQPLGEDTIQPVLTGEGLTEPEPEPPRLA